MRSQLIINAGSATIKYNLFVGPERKIKVHYQREGKSFRRMITKGGRSQQKSIRSDVFHHSLKDLLSLPELQSILISAPPQQIGFRVVHGGVIFKKPTVVTRSVIKKLKSLDALAPLHNPQARILIEEADNIFPELQKILFFDTAFHQSIPEINQLYALPKKLTKKEIKRYGFHGIVCSSVVHQLQKQRQLKKRLIVCQLGSGCSVTAIQEGKSIDTSMGFTPLEGLVMGTRAGDIDPGILLHWQKEKGISVRDLENILNHESGLKALSGTSDMKEIIKRSKKKEPVAVLALEIFCSKVAKYIASYVVSLQGIEQLVFSGGIGANAPLIRQTICQYLKPLGIRIDTRKNQVSKPGERVQKRFSRIEISWLDADESSEMNRQLLDFHQ